MQKEYVTKSEIARAVGCPPYVVAYLDSCRRLPIIRHQGQGRPTLFAPKAIEIVKAHLDRPRNGSRGNIRVQ